MEENVAGAVTYMGGWITGLIFLLTDKRQFVRFHAAQSVLVFGLLNILTIIFAFTSSGLAMLIYIVTAGAWFTLILKASQHQWYKLPLVGKIAAALPPPLAQTFSALADAGASISNAGGSAPASSTPAAGMPPSGVPAPGAPVAGAAYDPKRTATTAKLVGLIGRWTQADADKVMGGVRINQGPLDDGQQMSTYRYRNYMMQLSDLELTFNSQNGLLQAVCLNPQSVSLGEIRSALGDNYLDRPIPGTPLRACEYNQLGVGLVVDGNQSVRKIVFSTGANPASLFSSSVVWPVGMPWISGQLVAPEPLPKFS